MSVVEPQINTEQDSAQDNDHVASPHGEPDSAVTITSEQSEPADHAEIQSESRRLSLSDLQVNQNSAPQEVEETKLSTGVGKATATSSKKGPMSVSTTAKANGDTPIPLVKRIINSGTFGSGSVKPAPGVKTAVSGGSVATKPAFAVSTLKRSTSVAPAAAKPTVASRAPAASAAAPNRRVSIVPANPSVPASARNPLSSSVNSKPSTASDPAKARNSVVSPTGSVTSAKSAAATRSRASISDAAKKPAPTRTTATASRVSTTAKPATSTRTAASSVGKATATGPSGSISSIRVLKEDSKALEGLQRQLKEVEESLKDKTDSVGALEVELQKLQTSFQTALQDIQSKAALVTDLETEKAALEAQLKEAQASLEDRAGHDALLEKVKDELESAKIASQDSTSQIEKFQAQIAELEATVATSQGTLQSLQANHDIALSDAAHAHAVEHEALLKATADFEAISKEAEALRASHADSYQVSRTHIEELELKAAELDILQSQLNECKVEKEESANKISELEIEVLELKEQIEDLEDAQNKLKATITALEAELAKSAQVLEETIKTSNDREAEAKAQVEALNAVHAQEVNESSERFSALQETLRSLQKQLSTALAAHEKAAKEIVAAQATHDEQVQQLEAKQAAKEAELNSRIATIQESLDNQEAIYNSKVQTVKDERDILLKEAFERAKNEAGTTHAQELHGLQDKSNAIIAEIQTQNKSTLESLQKDHTGELESTVKSYTKQINNLNLELKATKDDLLKSKVALEEVRKELEAVKEQRDAARASAGSAPAVLPEHLEEVTRLTKELAVAKDDLAAVTDMLNLTKSSLAEMSEKHQTDLEETAQSRAEEKLKLSAAHDEEIRTLASQKSDLLIRLSDLEGDLATAKAALAAAQTASPKANGGAPQPSPGVSKEELAKLHEAHTLKIYDLQAEHEKSLKALREELEKSQEKSNQLGQEVDRKNMEIKYLEQDQEENQGEITRLTEMLELSSGKTDTA